MRRFKGRGLSSGTSPERIAPESLTPVVSGFVHRNISRSQSIQRTRSSLSAIDKLRFSGKILKRFGHDESNQNAQRVKPIPTFKPANGRHREEHWPRSDPRCALSVDCFANARNDGRYILRFLLA